VIKRFIETSRVVIAFIIISAVSSCRDDGFGVDTFPPMANDNPPGASLATKSTASALGRGVNFDHLFEWTTVGENFPIADQLIAKAKEGGFKTIRLPIRWSNHASATAPYTIDPVFFSQVESVVDEALAQGLYVIVNMHHHRQLDGDTLDVGDITVDNNIVDVRFLTMWKQIAARFRAKSNRLLFELYNEPHGQLTDLRWNSLIARALNSIRNTNPTRVVIIGPTVWNTAGALSELRLPNDANLIVTIHHYEPFNFTHQGAEWLTPMFPTGLTCCSPTQQSQIDAPLNMAKAWSDTNGYPIYVGEFGAYQTAAMASRVNFTRYLRDQAEARDMTWAYWEMSSGFGVYDLATQTWRADLLNALMSN
jgi:endoglucanase